MEREFALAFAFVASLCLVVLAVCALPAPGCPETGGHRAAAEVR